MRYLIITPAHNEEQYIESTLQSVINQSLLPAKWIIVNDGSTDRTRDIVELYCKQFPWISIINVNSTNEKRAVGSKVVKAFYAGYDTLSNTKDYDFIVKLDADLELPLEYFEHVAHCFSENKKVGLCGGYCSVLKKDKWIKEKAAPYHIRGPFKSYRREAFEQIDGLQEIMGWDGLDQMQLLYYRWEIKVLPLQVLHLRKTGTATDPQTLYRKIGTSYYLRGIPFIFSILRSLSLCIGRKNFFYGYYFFLGYLGSFLKKDHKVVSKELEKFIRTFYYNRILKSLHLKQMN